ncbi:MAG TPA: response regulator [Chthoniobacterales bacterium]|nr:response regulator [Chthoniobacterales bacterium]
MKAKILIVDDEPNVRLSYRVALETEGYVVKEAHCGARALDELAAGGFDLAILDMRMPEMDGLDLLAEMRNRGFTTPTVIITAFGDVPHAVRAMKLGAIDFLKKPITPQALRNIVTDVVSRHQTKATPASPPRDDFHDHIVTAQRLLNFQDFAQAKKHLVRALELNDKSPEAFNLTGVLFEMQEDYERAKKYYGQAIKLNKHYEPAQQNMRRVFELFHFGTSKEPIALGDD